MYSLRPALFRSTSIARGCRVLSVQFMKGVTADAVLGRTHFATPVPVSATKTVLASAEREKPESDAPVKLRIAVQVTVSPGAGSAGDGA